jgi:hypothetical protein
VRALQIIHFHQKSFPSLFSILNLPQYLLQIHNMSNQFQNVLVAGATGKLGAQFVDALLESDLKFHVKILARESALNVRYSTASFGRISLFFSS